MRQLTVGTVFKKTENWPCSADRRAEITDLLCEIIYQDLRPLAMIRTTSFRKFFTFVEPNYPVPSSKTVCSNIVRVYDVQRQKILEQLTNLSLPSLTTDHWASATNDAYLGATAHGMTSDWEVKALYLGTRVTSERHTAENIAHDLQNICHEWELNAFSFTHDDAANMVAAMVKLEAHSVPCFAHTIQLAINAGLSKQSVSNMVANARSLAGFFHKSTQHGFHCRRNKKN